MNLSILKNPGTWITLVAALLALLVNQGVILSGSTLDTVLSYIIGLAGTLTGHVVAGLTGPATPTATQSATVTK